MVKGSSKGDRLAEYRAKRDFQVTPEPDRGAPSTAGDLFVVQMHDATRLHYDLRLELGGVLKSWAVTRGPSLDPKIKRLAVHTEDHPVTYGRFEGLIPEGEYGGGPVILWDTGRWVPMSEDPASDIAAGHLKFRLDGEKLKGGFALVKLKGGRAGVKDWLLVKERDIYARPESEGIITEDAPRSVVSGRTVAELEARLAPAPRTRAARPRAEKLPGAKPATMPDRLEPALATLVDEPPEGREWLHEIKFDGYRTIAHIAGGKVVLRTRNGHDWTDRYGALAEAFAKLPCREAVIDGEVCVQLPNGATSFPALQEALAAGDDHRMVFFAFDLPYLDGHDLRAVPLERRKTALLGVLQDHLDGSSALQYSDHTEGSGHEFFAQAANLGLEGIISKRRDSPYTSGRGREWLKTKGAHAGEFVVVGFDESKAAGGLGALVLGETANHKLRYAGHFHWLHKDTKNRIQMKPHDPELGVVDRKDLVKGYEFEKDQYVVFSDEELDEVEVESSKTITIEEFVDAADVDPMYLDTPYYLAPDGPVAEETYRVVQLAMAQRKKAAVARVVMGGRERIVLLMPRDKGFVLNTLRSAAEVRAHQEYFAEINDGAVEKGALKLAEQLIDQYGGKFDTTEFVDQYQLALMEVVKAKVKGTKPVISKAPERGKVINLMDALKRSIDEGKGKKPPAPSKSREAAAGEARAPKAKSRAKRAAAS